jgi:hypothetical protein
MAAKSGTGKSEPETEALGVAPSGLSKTVQVDVRQTLAGLSCDPIGGMAEIAMNVNPGIKLSHIPV